MTAKTEMKTAQKRGRVPGSEKTQFKPGQSGNPKGRTPGTRNYMNRLTNEQRQQIAAMTGGLTPLELFISICRDETVPINARLDAAKAAAPYLHRRMPISIEGGDPSKPINIMDVAALRNLSKSELATLIDLLKKAGANIQGG